MLPANTWKATAHLLKLPVGVIGKSTCCQSISAGSSFRSYGVRRSWKIGEKDLFE